MLCTPSNKLYPHLRAFLVSLVYCYEVLIQCTESWLYYRNSPRFYILLCRAVSTLLLHMYSGEVCSGQLHSSPLLPLALCRSRCSIYGVCPLERFCGCGRQEPPSSLPPHPTSLLLCYIFLLLCLWTAATELENSFQLCEATLAAAMDPCLLCVSSVWVLSSATLHVSHICTYCLIPRPPPFSVLQFAFNTTDRSRRVAKRALRLSLFFATLIGKPKNKKKTGKGWEWG